jgi:hypothetical protein
MTALGAIGAFYGVETSTSSLGAVMFGLAVASLAPPSAYC